MTDEIVQHAARLWYASNLRVAIALGHSGDANGYCQLPEGHPDLGKSHHDIDVDVHYGLTYGVDEHGWLGFDTAHAFDRWYPPDREELIEATPEPWRSQVRKYIRTIAVANKALFGLDQRPTEWDRVWTTDRLVIETEVLAATMYERAVRAAAAKRSP
jgi:hypothetical protein